MQQLEERETMTTINVAASNLLGQMYDQGGYETLIKSQLDMF